MIKTQFLSHLFWSRLPINPPPQKKNIFSSYPLKPNSHADNSLAAIPSEILTNPLPPPLPKNNIAYNISKLLIKFKKKKQKQTTNTLTRSILSSWQMVDVSKPFFPPQNLVPIARGSCDVIRMECEKSGFLIGPFVPHDTNFRFWLVRRYTDPYLPLITAIFWLSSGLPLACRDPTTFLTLFRLVDLDSHHYSGHS